MDRVYAKIEPGREWVLRVDAVPATAVNQRDCGAQFLRLSDGGHYLPAGTVVAECLKNDRGVQAAVVMPNGYLFPTGRIAPQPVWVPMLKAHLRGLLAMTPDGRVLHMIEVGLATYAQLRASGAMAEDLFQQAVAKLAGFRAKILGELPPAAGEDELLRGFYNWVTAAAQQTGLDQHAVVAAVGRAIRAGRTVPVPDLAGDVLGRDFQRFLDL